MMPSMDMPNPKYGILIFLQPGKSHTLKIIHDALFHRLGNPLARGKRQHTGRVLMLEGQRVDELPHQRWIATQHHRRRGS
jgi:hypothetical protein